MVYVLLVNLFGKGNCGKVEGIGECIEGVVDFVIEVDDYVVFIQFDKMIEICYE